MRRNFRELAVMIGRSIYYQIRWKIHHRCRPGPPERDDEGKLIYPCPECSRPVQRGGRVDLPGRGYNRVPD